MNASDVYELIKKSIPASTRAHYLSYNVHIYPRLSGHPHPCIGQISDIIGKIDDDCIGYAKEMVRRISSLGGLDQGKYQQIIQILCEIHVVYHAWLMADRDNSGEKLFEHEPSNRKGGKNPEIRTAFSGIPYCAEVKTPSLLEFQRARRSSAVEFAGRLPLVHLFKGEELIKPQDNKIKDFLESAQSKFETYQEAHPDDWTFVCRLGRLYL